MHDSDDVAVFILGAVLGIVIGAVCARPLFRHDYRQGVIDAQLGKVRIEMIEHEDGTRKWGKVQDTDGGE
jgi:uncharacterized membrane-anchored protein YhcB (DUF1043 family)